LNHHLLFISIFYVINAVLLDSNAGSVPIALIVPKTNKYKWLEEAICHSAKKVSQIIV
jgi:hypothetical protein